MITQQITSINSFSIQNFWNLENQYFLNKCKPERHLSLKRTNKGIGFDILENLIHKQSYKVIITQRFLEISQMSRTKNTMYSLPQTFISVHNIKQTQLNYK
ncbi:unnamed protein product [Paramecium primaurelia]|uniref:Uncharacterized protein n=1 Tax=Paramecium primaurelia TaxID=5886 RepID=A0A8S1MYU2_PARPR|nr:unnamed protein product [Paramecium primaurelia]